MGAERVTAGRLDGGGLGWPWRVAGPVVVVLLAAVVGVGRARAALPSNCSQNGEVVTCSFSSTNFPDQTFEVPAGISSVGVVAVGAPGGPAGPRFPSPTPGGAGAVASGTLSVTGGQTLYVNVGGAGDAGFTDSAGGFNGGGPGDTAPGCGCPGSGGGGGASDVRTAPYSAGLDPDPRLVVAGGGGGAGAAGGPPTIRGGAGGAAGQQGLAGTPLGSLGAGGGGLPGTTSFYANGGTGGTGGDIGGQMGSSGGLGGGGGATTDGAGGGAGGGGVYGGGQGGEGAGNSNAGTFAAGGGGGGGSSLVPDGRIGERKYHRADAAGDDHVHRAGLDLDSR